MATAILLAVGLSYFIPKKVTVCLLILIYWMPKFLLYNTIESIYPEIQTRVKDLSVTDKQVALTFDDLPYGSHIDLINTLDKYNIKATFFVISGDFYDRSAFVAAVKNGHQLGNHGKVNQIHALLSVTELEHEFDHCDQLIKSIYSEADVPLPKRMVYRPGSGLPTTSMLEMVKEKNYTLSLGSVYPSDPIVPSGLVNYYYVINHIENGDVIILHDRRWTSPMLELLLPWMKQNNYLSVTLDELFD